MYSVCLAEGLVLEHAFPAAPQYAACRHCMGAQQEGAFPGVGLESMGWDMGPSPSLRLKQAVCSFICIPWRTKPLRILDSGPNSENMLPPVTSA